MFSNAINIIISFGEMSAKIIPTIKISAFIVITFR